MKLHSVLLSVFLAGVTVAFAQQAKPNAAGAKKGNGGTPAQFEARAKRMVKNAKDLLENNEEERAVGMLEAVPKMYPDAPSRFVAWLELGRYQIDKRQFDQALGSLRKAIGSEVYDVRAEAMLLQGKCQLTRGEAGEAAMILRRVTQDYPTSLFANDAYFLIGQIHFEAGRWARAAEAFNMVGTAVPSSGKSNEVVLAEAGQRIYVHVTDKDLAVLEALGEHSEVVLQSKSGDQEKATLVGFGRGDGDFLASVPTTTDPSQPFDGKLTVIGADSIAVAYVDQNTESGAVRQAKNADARIVSTATLTFMDGAQRQRVRGVFVGQPAFMRLRDLDCDTSAAADKVNVTLVSQYRERPESMIPGVPPPPPEPDAPWLTRSSVDVVLTETGPRTGIFTGRFTPILMNTDTNKPATVAKEGELLVLQDDKVIATYEDVAHLEGTEPETRRAVAAVLVGGSTEPQSIVANASDATVQARKLLLEAQLLHKWGSIFKDVGLNGHAAEKAEEGLEKVADLMSLATRFSLPRDVIENAFAVKWDLQLVQGNLGDAITTCRALVKLYPDTTLADRAFMQIGKARAADKKNPNSIQSAIQVFNAIISLPSSPLKAEAQFRIGEAVEQRIKAQAANRGQKPDYSAAMSAFKRCAEAYPESSYAGDSFKKVIDYYISIRDYPRCVETLERVFQDYPDAPWLDEMLLKWGVVCYRMGNRAGALEKFRKLVEEYPGGQAAAQGQPFLRRLSDD